MKRAATVTILVSTLPRKEKPQMKVTEKECEIEWFKKIEHRTGLSCWKGE